MTSWSDLIAVGRQELKAYAHFVDGWDGYQANRFSPIVLARAEAIIDLFESWFMSKKLQFEKITTGPASDGSIDIEIMIKNRCLNVTIEPSKSHSLHVFLSCDDSQEEMDILDNEFVLMSWLDKLTQDN